MSKTLKKDNKDLDQILADIEKQFNYVSWRGLSYEN